MMLGRSLLLVRPRIAVYGGSFNPFGCHHQAVIRWLVTEGDFTVVLVIPSVDHALKHDLIPFHHRYNMAVLGVRDLESQVSSLPPHATVSVLMVEMEMLQRQVGPIYTYDLLCEIRSGLDHALGNVDEIQFAIGPDIRAEFPKWKHVAEIDREFGFVDIPADLSTQGVRATHIREMVSRQSEAWQSCVPHQVAWYIHAHSLYQTETGKPAG